VIKPFDPHQRGRDQRTKATGTGRRRYLVVNHLRSSQQNYYIDGRGKSTKKKGRKDGMKIGVDGKIPWNEET